jgi:hypothetical protein
MLPRSTAGRLLAAAWLLFCLGALVFAWEKRQLKDMPEALVLLMGFASAPVSFAVAPLVGWLQGLAKSAFSIPYDHFTAIVPVWLALSIAGYLQWFLLLPRLFRKR